MRASRVVGFLAVVALSLILPATWGEETPAAQGPAAPKRGSRPGDVQKIFIIKNVNVDDMARLLSVFPAEISGADRGSLRALAVSAPPAVLAAIEETIKRLDVSDPAGKSVDITGYVLECSTKDASSPPTELQDVVTQLKRTFSYSGCTLAQTLFTRGSEHNGFRSVSRESPGGTSLLLAEKVEIDASQTPRVIRFRSLSFQGNNGEGFNGSVAMRDGQRVVLGKLGSREPGKDQVLVLTAKVVD